MNEAASPIKPTNDEKKEIKCAKIYQKYCSKEPIIIDKNRFINTWIWSIVNSITNEVFKPLFKKYKDKPLEVYKCINVTDNPNFYITSLTCYVCGMKSACFASNISSDLNVIKKSDIIFNSTAYNNNGIFAIINKYTINLANIIDRKSVV